MTYEFLQAYWWFLISLLGALLVFLMFVQGANTLIFCLGKRQRSVVSSSIPQEGSGSLPLPPSSHLEERSSHHFLSSIARVSEEPIGYG